jgi:uncharacterized protein YggE
MKGIITTLAILLVAFVAVKVVAGVKAMGHVAGAPSETITVSGKGEVTAKPDIATFSFTVSEESPVVSTAQDAMNDKMDKILDYVSKSGVEEKDVKTLSYNIYPRYEYQGANYYQSGKQILAAYVVSQTIQVKVRKLEDAGALLTGIGEFGATDVSGLSFSIDDDQAVQHEARDKAIADARTQAQALAKSLGVRLGDIVSFSESSYGYPMPIYYAKDAAYGMGGATEARNQASIPSGENLVTSNVSITYEIR